MLNGNSIESFYSNIFFNNNIKTIVIDSNYLCTTGTSTDKNNIWSTNSINLNIIISNNEIEKKNVTSTTFGARLSTVKLAVITGNTIKADVVNTVDGFFIEDGTNLESCVVNSNIGKNIRTLVRTSSGAAASTHQSENYSV